MRSVGIAILLSLLGATAVLAEPFPFPPPDQFRPAVLGQDALLDALDTGATATTCTLEEGRLSCECIETSDVRFDIWRADAQDGYLKTAENSWVWIESLTTSPTRVAYGLGDQGFTATLQPDGTLTDVELGEIERPSNCGDSPKVHRIDATADRAKFADDQWTLHRFSDGGPPVSVGEFATSGWLVPSLQTDGDTFELQTGAYVAPLQSGVVVNGSNRWVGLGVSTPTRHKNRHRYLTVQGRYDFDESEFRPFVAGDLYWGNDLTHLSARVEHPQPGQFSDTRQLDRTRLFRNVDVTAVGLSLSGEAFTFQSTFGAITDNASNDTDVLLSARYGTRFQIGVIDVDLSARYDADQRDSADDRLLQSTTVVARFSKNLLERGLTLRPSVILASNFGVLPVDNGIDSSATGVVIAQVDAGIPIVARFENLTHRIEPRVSVGRDIGGFQQRFLRDGASPFPFSRISGQTFAQLEVLHAIETVGWSVRTPFGVQMFDDGSAALSPWASVVMTHGSAILELVATCETIECDVARYSGSAGFSIASDLSARYTLSNFTAAQTSQRLGPSLVSDPTVSVLWTQQFPLVVAPDWIHFANVTGRVFESDVSLTIAYDASTESGGGIASVTRVFPRLGWAVSGEFGIDATFDNWNASLGFKGSFTAR